MPALLSCMKLPLVLLLVPLSLAEKKPVIVTNDCEGDSCSSGEVEVGLNTPEANSARQELSEVLEKLESSKPTSKESREAYIESLLEGLQHAESAALPHSDSTFVAAQAAADRLERQIDALDTLEKINKEAKHGVDAQSLEVILAEAMKAGLSKKDLASAQKLLRKAKREQAAEESLRKAYDTLRLWDVTGAAHSHSEDSHSVHEESFNEMLQTLNASVKEAKAAGVDPSEVKEAKEFLEHRAVWWVARKNLTELLRAKAAPDAVMEAHDVLRDLQDHGSDSVLMHEAEAFVDAEHKKTEALQHVYNLVHSRDRLMIEHAIRDAEEAGVPDKELRRAKLELREMIDQHKAAMAVGDAVKTRNMKEIRQAIAKAEKLGVERSMLQHARNVLQDLEHDLQYEQEQEL